MGINTLPACPTVPLSSQQTHYLNCCRSWHHSDGILLQFCHLTSSLCHSTLLAAHLPAPLSPGAQRASHFSIPVPPASAWRGWAQSTELTWGGRTLTPRTVLLDGPGIVLFPTTEKLEWTEELPEAREGQLTVSPFTPGRRNSEKGRKNSGPCCMLTGEAGETQGTSECTTQNMGEAPGDMTDPAQTKAQTPLPTSV